MRDRISLTSRHAVKDLREGARWMIERARAAREAALDSLFLGDHHATAVPYYQNVPMLGRLLAEWGDAPAGCLFLLPLWNPVLVAEQVGTLAAIARGRFILQCGLGGDEAQFAAMGASLTTRPSAFEEALSLIRRLLAGEVVSSSGRFTVKDARVALRSAEPVEVWIGAGAALPIAARRRRSRSVAMFMLASLLPTPRRSSTPRSPGDTVASIRRRSSRARWTKSSSVCERSGRWVTPTSSSAISPMTSPRSSARSRVSGACGRRSARTSEGGFAPLPKPPPLDRLRGRSPRSKRGDSEAPRLAVS